MLRAQIHWLPSHHLFFKVTQDRLNKPFDPATYPGEDMDFVFRLLCEGKAGFVNAPLFYTRQHQASQTAHIGGDFNFIYTGLQRLERFGHIVLSPDEIERIRLTMHWQVLRHVIAWRLSGHIDLVKQHLSRLERGGFNPKALDYFLAVLTWPRHKIRNELRRVTDATFLRFKEFREEEFIRRSLLYCRQEGLGEVGLVYGSQAAGTASANELH